MHSSNDFKTNIDPNRKGLEDQLPVPFQRCKLFDFRSACVGIPCDLGKTHLLPLAKKHSIVAVGA